MICSPYGVQWQSLPLISPREEKEAGKLKNFKKEQGVVRPKLLGVASSPSYSKEPQANPFHSLLLQLPKGNEWHSKSDVEAQWGSYENRMQKYWDRSGQTYPTKPRKSEERSRLQEIAVEFLKAGADLSATTEDK